jgi:hypothetical protein
MVHRVPGRRLPHRRILILALAASLLLTQLPAVAFAEHGGREIGSLLNCDRPVTPPRCTSVGDDLRHHVAFDASLSSGLAVALRRAMSDVYGQTRLILTEDRAVTPRTDVIAYSGDFGDIGAAAWVYCPSEAPQGVNEVGDRWCRHQELYFNLNARFAAFFDDEPSREHVACHELGHTLGLRHWGNPPQSAGPAAATCMTANTPNGATSLHQIDIDHIDAYPYRVPRRSPALWLVRGPGDGRIVAGGPGKIVGASEVEQFGSLEALVAGADLIVHGRVTAVEAGRAFGPPTRPLVYAQVTVAVEEILAGRTSDAAGSAVTLEVPLLDGPSSLERVRDRMLGTERVLFLRDKAGTAAAAGLPLVERMADRGFHRLVTFGSELVELDGLALAPPDESRVLERFNGRPFAQVVAELRAIGTAGD